MPHDLVNIGGGPAGMVAGLLFARAGLKTLVLDTRKRGVHPRRRSSNASFFEHGCRLEHRLLGNGTGQHGRQASSSGRS